MYTQEPYGKLPQYKSSQEYEGNLQTSQKHLTSNRFIYVKKQMHRESGHSIIENQTVLVNPHFKVNKVFVNPNFSGVHSNKIHVNPRLKNVTSTVLGNKHSVNNLHHNPTNVSAQSTKVFINPNAKCVQIAPRPLDIVQTSQTVHINPKFKNVISKASMLGDAHLKDCNKNISIPQLERKEISPSKVLPNTIVLTRTKLIRAPNLTSGQKLRRNSIKSKYKIVKSSVNLNKSEDNKKKVSCNKYKIDYRRKSLTRSLSAIIAKNQKKYLYSNKFVSISDLAKTHVIKNNIFANVQKNMAVVNISGVVYRKSRTSLRRASSLPLRKSPNRTVQKSKYRLVKKPVSKKSASEKNVSGCMENTIVKRFKIVRKTNSKKDKTLKVSPKKLRKCNIPCPFYKKYGICKGKENGKCFRKHDPDQVALCTRFLQGACINENCLLSHNVSPEKMPTCKYYLEGSCSKENCPYLHVKINAKAEVCRDFLEGFCKKAAECDKRHQYLCPDYEKHGKCPKQRCPYPHGKMVRKYFSNKIKFAKKSSDLKKKLPNSGQNSKQTTKSSEKCIDPNLCKNMQPKETKRYYIEKPSEIDKAISTESAEKLESTTNSDGVIITTTKNFVGLQSRPKLGSLPAFIPFGK